MVLLEVTIIRVESSSLCEEYSRIAENSRVRV